MDLKDKVAVVTGSSGAIGKALSELLTQNGVKCILIDKEGEYKCDFSKVEELVRLADRITAENIKVDYLFNVAGVGIYKKIEELDLEEWQSSFAINVTAPYILSKKLLPLLKQSINKPMIFNIGSGMGVIPAEERIAYCSSKFALRGLSLSLQKELRLQNIDVCLLTLGSVMSPFGTGGIDKRKELERDGKKYLTIDEVVNKIISITKSETREQEYTMYPEGYI